MKLIITCLLIINPLITYCQKEDIIQLKDSKICIYSYGEGNPVLIINGGPGMNSNGFATLAIELGKTHRAILYDQRGTGKSEINTINSKTMTMEFMVKDIEAIRTHLKIKNWVVLGHSFGGMLASYYTSKYPKHVSALILSSSGGVDLTLLSTLNMTSRLRANERDSLNYWTRKITHGDTSYQTAYNRGKYLAPAYLYNKTYVPLIAKRLTQGHRLINNLIWQNMRYINFDCKKALKNYSKPVLIIQGAHDIIGKKIPETTHDLFPNSELYYLDQSAHYGWMEQPNLYFGKINAFLAALH